MIHSLARSRRRGAVVVESAIIFPVVFFLLLGLIVGALGIYRYQEMAFLAQEGARYAAVRGNQYQKEVAGASAASSQDVYDKVIRPKAVALDLSKLSYSVTWTSSNEPYTTVSNYEKPVGNTVTVTVTYEWLPKMYLVGPIRLRGTSTLPISY